MSVAHRLYSNGAFVTSTVFDEITRAQIGFASNVVYAGQFDETQTLTVASRLLHSSGPGSISLNGTSQYLSVPTSGIGTLSGNAFTIETWVNLTGYSVAYGSTYQAEIFSGTSTAGGSGGGLQFGFLGTASSWTGIRVYAALGSTVYLTNTWTYAFSLNTWYHIALTKDLISNNWTVYINGVGQTPYTNSSTWTDTSPYTIGYNKQSGYAAYFPGYITDFRIITGVVGYNSNFTPPTASLPAVANTTLLLNVLNSGQYLTDSSTVNNTVTAVGSPTYASLSPYASTSVPETLQVAGYFDEVSMPTISSTYNSYNYQATTAVSSNVVVSGVSLGTADSSRIVVLYLTTGLSTSAHLNAVMVNGYPATMAVRNSTSDFRLGEIWYAPVTAGTSATVECQIGAGGTWSAGGGLAIASYSIYNPTNSTPFNSNSSYLASTNVAPDRYASVTMPTQQNSVVIGGYSAGAVATPSTTTWSTLSVDLDTQPPGDNQQISSASGYFFGTSSVNVNVIVSDTVVNRPGLVLVSWQ